jgi:N-acetyl-gamma-glutamylphosphate reductase
LLCDQKFRSLMQTRQVAIVGASGYSGEELVRLLLVHPFVELTQVTSRQYVGRALGEIFPKFANHPRAKSLQFTEPNVEALGRDGQIVFLALPHGVASEFAEPLLRAGCKVIDLSADFRLKDASRYKEFYGMIIRRRNYSRKRFTDYRSCTAHRFAPVSSLRRLGVIPPAFSCR